MDIQEELFKNRIEVSKALSSALELTPQLLDGEGNTISMEEQIDLAKKSLEEG